jgi:hypothetical protein
MQVVPLLTPLATFLQVPLTFTFSVTTIENQSRIKKAPL